MDLIGNINSQRRNVSKSI